MEIDWEKGCMRRATPSKPRRTALRWRQCARDTKSGNGGRDSHLLPESEARYIRIAMHGSARGYGMSDVHVRDLQFGASPNAFIESLAKKARRGCYPRAYSNEQTYWTIIGADGGDDESMLSEDGALELRKGSFSIEP